MSGWQQFSVAVIVALIAPVALYFQQAQQNRRERDREERQAREARDAAEGDRVEREKGERRAAYLAVIRAAHRYRAERAPDMLRLDQAWAAEPTNPEMSASVIRRWPPASTSLPLFMEAIGEARLWAAGQPLTGELETLLHNADEVEACLTRGTEGTTLAATRAWSTFTETLRQYSVRASDELEGTDHAKTLGFRVYGLHSGGHP